MTKAEMKRLEREHLRCTLTMYGPLPASDVARIANEECVHDDFDPLPMISPRGITMKLQGMSLAGLVKGTLEVAGGPIMWDVTDKGRVAGLRTDAAASGQERSDG